MAELEPTDNMILMRIVEVIGRRRLHADQVICDDEARAPSIVILGDQYTTGQAGSVGPNSSANETSFIQIWNQAGSAIDLPALALQLAKVRAGMREISAGSAEQDLSIAEVARAELSAKKNDGPAVMKHLREAGMWALDIAKSVSTDIAVAAIKAAMGIP